MLIKDQRRYFNPEVNEWIVTWLWRTEEGHELSLWWRENKELILEHETGDARTLSAYLTKTFGENPRWYRVHEDSPTGQVPDPLEAPEKPQESAELESLELPDAPVVRPGRAILDQAEKNLELDS